MSALFEFNGIRKSFSGVPVLQGIDLSVGRGSITGLAGGNGAGKSTLMNLAGGVLQPDSGTMRMNGRDHAPRNPAAAEAAGISFVHQELNLFPNLSIAENLFLTGFPRRGPFIRRAELVRRAEALMGRVGLNCSPLLAVDHLTPGERQLAEIAKALHGDASLIILDEPTTSLSPRERERLFSLVRALRSEGCAFVFISHDLREMLSLCDRVVVLRDGNVAAAGCSREFTVSRLVSAMAGREETRLFPEKPEPRLATGSLLEVRDLSRTGVVENIRFTLRAGEILGLSGLMGAGRTELAEVLFGLRRHDRGDVILDGVLLKGGPRDRIRAGMAMVTENRSEEGICADAPVRDNVALTTLESYVSGPLRLVSASRKQAAIDRIGTAVHLPASRRGLEPVRRLSGGNQQKVVLARCLLSNPRVLILDEPTRGIDAAAKFEIYQLILERTAAGSGIILISSEEEELFALCDRILVLSRGRIAGEFSRSEFDHASLLRAALTHHMGTPGCEL